MTNGYSISLEDGVSTFGELEPLYRLQYAEMQKRLAGEGVKIGPMSPRLDRYFEACRAGYLLHYVARFCGRAVGYSNVYLTSDMHNGELIAKEDTVYIIPEHRNGMGRKLVKHVLADLKARGVKRWNVQAVTDPRAAKLWQRMGFKPVGVVMSYTF